MRHALRHNPETASEMYAIAVDALKQARMERGNLPRRRELVAQAKQIYEETIKKFPKAWVPMGLAQFHFTGKTDIDELAKLIRLPTWDSIYEANDEYILTSGFESVDGQQFDSEDERDEAVADGSAAAEAEIYHQWHNGVSAAADRAFQDHGLQLKPIGKAPFPWQFKIGAINSWEDAAAHLIATINGVGTFYIESVKTFVESGPYESTRVAVLDHLGNLYRRPEVYGDRSYRTTYDWGWR